MVKMIKLHFVGGKEVYFNPMYIREIYQAEKATMLWMLNDKECYNIEETAKEILNIIKNG